MQEIETWLRQRLAQLVGVEPEDIGLDQPLEELGLSSQDAVGLSGEMEERFALTLSPTIIWEFPTIRALAGHVSCGCAGGRVEAPVPNNAAGSVSGTGGVPLAIVGMACRFPGAPDLAALWALLSEGRSAVSEIPASRWRINDYYDSRPAVPGKMNSRWGGFLEGIEDFDHHFFGITRREAARMDPCQRLLLEVSWETLEDACCPPQALAAVRTGVFVGISTNDYKWRTEDPSRIDAYAATGNALSVAANRLSYVLNLCGPSIAVDTACASSLTALHLAGQSLAAGECDAALVGGVNVMLAPETNVALSQARMLAADGRCKTFDAAADGYVRGEGCGVLLLKRLADAERDQDRIHGIIRGTAIAHGGRSNGLMAPNRRALQQVMREAYRAADTTTSRIGCIEVQGTGSPLGDAIEVDALKAVFPQDGDFNCALGSIKTNMGHLEAASGIAGVMKMVLALKHAAIPAHLNLQTLNPQLGLEGSGFTVPTSLTPWPPATMPRQGAVTAYGFGGAAAHVVLEEAVAIASAQAAADTQPFEHLLCLSAKSEAALRTLLSRYIQFLDASEAVPLRDICYSANIGRAHFNARVAVWAPTHEGMREKLQAFLAGTPGASTWCGNVDLAAEHHRRITRAAGGQLVLNNGSITFPVLAAPGEDGCPPLTRWLAELYTRDAMVDWPHVYAQYRANKVTLPTYPFQRVRCWLESLPEDLRRHPGSNARGANGHGPQQKRGAHRHEERGRFSMQLLGATQEERLHVLRSYLEERVARALGISREELNPEQSLLELGLDSLMMMEILGELSQDLCVVVYPREVFDRPTVAQLAAYVSQELLAVEGDTESHKNGNGRTAPATAESSPAQAAQDACGQREALKPRGIDFFKLRLHRTMPGNGFHRGHNPPAIFLLSTPRSGSTLLRVMLAGHSQLFCPPELHLLPFRSMGERQRELEGTGLESGLPRALMEQGQVAAEEAERMVEMLVKADVPIQHVYRLLQEGAGSQVLLDKSPTYAGAVEIMQRAERLFDAPKYIYLTRHPLSVIESLVHTRLDQMVASRAASPHQTAEAIWTLGNYNIRTFLRGVDSARWHAVSYEDLVRQPEEISQRLCTFLGMEFEPAVLTPYAGKRMTDGLAPGENSVGDPRFLLHERINPAFGEKWREVHLPSPLKPATARLAAEMGYELPDDGFSRRGVPGALGAAMEGTL